MSLMSKLKKLTVDELFNHVWDEYWDCDRFVRSGHAREVKHNYVNRIKEPLGHKALAKVTVMDVKKWHQGFRETPFAANRTLEILSKLFHYALVNGMFVGFNPCRAVRPFVEKSRERHANESELVALLKVAEKYKEKWPLQITFILTLLYSGARPRSLERANWHDVSPLENGFGQFTFEGKSTSKTGENEKVIFPPNIMQLLSKLPRRRDNLIFGINIPKKIWYKVREEAGCPDLWARDLRRTFASILLNQGVALNTIGDLLNHRSVQTTKIYAKLNNQNKIDAVKGIEDKLTALFGTKIVGL